MDVELLDDGGHTRDDRRGLGTRRRGSGALFAGRPEAGLDPDAVHGRGIGLPLAREVAGRLGGDVWLADAGGPDGNGAVFCARLPAVMRPPSRVSEQKGTE